MEKYRQGNYFANRWLVKDPKAIVVIAHGMAEHPDRYDRLATFLNEKDFNVFAINHIGHGDAINNDKGHFDKNGFNDCVEHIRELILDIRKEYKLPIYLFGHSMGSFMSQAFIKKYSSDIEGVILSGSCKIGLLHQMGNIVAHLLFVFGDQRKPNQFLNNLSFGSYNNKFKPNRTAFDWLSRDNEEVDKYVNDDLCGYVCTTGFFKSFLKGMSGLNRNIDNIRKDLPILLIAGEDDPVGNFGEGVVELCHTYLRHHIKDVDIKLYEGARHELTNETNRDEVHQDLLTWLDNHVASLD